MKTSCIYDHAFLEQEKNSFSHNPKLLDNKSLWVSFIYKFLSKDVLMLVGEPVPLSKDAKDGFSDPGTPQSVGTKVSTFGRDYTKFLYYRLCVGKEQMLSTFWLENL
jgi:hypothetical protein